MRVSHQFGDPQMVGVQRKIPAPPLVHPCDPALLDDGNVVISPSHAAQDHDPTAGGTENGPGTPGGDPATRLGAMVEPQVGQ